MPLAIGLQRGAEMQIKLPSCPQSSYVRSMTNLLDQAFEAIRSRPPEAQDDIAGVVLRLFGSYDEAAPLSLTPAERKAIAKSKMSAARGEFATDEQVRAVWSKHGL